MQCAAPELPGPAALSQIPGLEGFGFAIASMPQSYPESPYHLRGREAEPHTRRSTSGEAPPSDAAPPSLCALTSSEDATGDSACRSRAIETRRRGGDDPAGPPTSSDAKADRAAMARSATDDMLMPRVVGRLDTGADDRRTAVPKIEIEIVTRERNERVL